MFGAGDITYWLLCVGVVVLMGVLIYVAWWGLFADRARGRRRCPRCWYDMAHAPPPGMTCPECGFMARRDAQFGRTRRRYGIASVAILLNVAIALIITERSMQRGVQALLPTHALIWALPLASDPNSPLMRELVFRATRAELTKGQWLSFMKRCVAGDWRARPLSDAWKIKYGECISSFRPLLIYEPQAEQPLLSLDPEVRITGREVWPIGAPVTLTLQMNEWWPLGTECRIRIAPQVKGVEALVVYRSATERWPRTPFAFHLPPLQSGSQEIHIDVHVDRRRVPVDRGEVAPSDGDAHAPPWEAVFDRTFRVQVNAAGAVEAAAQPATGQTLDDAIEDVFSNGVMKWDSGPSPVRFNIAATATFAKPFANTAVGLRVELMRENEVARRLHMWWLGGALGGASDYAGRNYGFEIDHENLALLQQLAADDLQHWRLRITGDPLIALRAGNAEKYWAGALTVPFRLIPRAGAAPPRPWRPAQENQAQ